MYLVTDRGELKATLGDDLKPVGGMGSISDPLLRETLESFFSEGVPDFDHKIDLIETTVESNRLVPLTRGRMNLALSVLGLLGYKIISS